MPGKDKSANKDVQHQAVMKDFVISLMTALSSVPGCPDSERKKIFNCVTEIEKAAGGDALEALGSKIETVCQSTTELLESAPNVEQQIEELSAMTNEVDKAAQSLLSSSETTLEVLDEYLRELDRIKREEPEPAMRAQKSRDILKMAGEAVAAFENKLNTGKSYVRKTQTRVQALAAEVHKTYTDSFKDSLTGLTNRNGLTSALADAMQGIDRTSMVSIVALDIDNFNVINDEYGRIVGNALLVKVAQALVNQLPKNAQIGRIGLDRFAVILPVDSGDAARDFAGSLQKRIRAARWTYNTNGKQYKVSTGVTIGVAVQRKADSPGKLFSRAVKELEKAMKKNDTMRKDDAK